MANGETTPPEQRGLKEPWKPGQSGNPAGRPKGSRNKLGEEFVAALQADFNANGANAIKTVREEKPAEYLKVIASIVPKELHIKDTSLEDMSDDELITFAAAVRSVIASGHRQEATGRTRKAKAEKDTVPEGRTH